MSADAALVIAQKKHGLDKLATSYGIGRSTFLSLCGVWVVVLDCVPYMVDRAAFEFSAAKFAVRGMLWAR